jgi:hypothetical protein
MTHGVEIKKTLKRIKIFRGSWFIDLGIFLFRAENIIFFVVKHGHRPRFKRGSKVRTSQTPSRIGTGMWTQSSAETRVQGRLIRIRCGFFAARHPWLFVFSRLYGSPSSPVFTFSCYLTLAFSKTNDSGTRTIISSKQLNSVRIFT